MRGRLLPILGYLVGAGQPRSNFQRAQTPSRAGTRLGVVMNEQGDQRDAHAYRIVMFSKELRKGPYTYDMEEKAYWDSLMSYTVELFSDTPDELERSLALVRGARRWYGLGKYAKAYPSTMEAAGYNMYDDAYRKSHERFDAIFESYKAGLIDRDEMTALSYEALARFRAVLAVANAFVPLQNLRLIGRKLELDQVV